MKIKINALVIDSGKLIHFIIGTTTSIFPMIRLINNFVGN